MSARGKCSLCATPVIGERADRRVWAHCICVGCLPPPKPLAERFADLGRAALAAARELGGAK